MRRVIAAVAMLGILTGPAFAQLKKDDEDTPMKLIEKAKKKDYADTDKQYKAAMEKTRSDKPVVRNDPWADMRAPSDSGKKQ